MATIIGIIALVLGIAGVFIGWVALNKAQALSVEFVKAHIQGIRAEAAKNTAAVNALTQKVAALEKRNQGDLAKENGTDDKIPPQMPPH